MNLPSSPGSAYEHANPQQTQFFLIYVLYLANGADKLTTVAIKHN